MPKNSLTFTRTFAASTYLKRLNSLPVTMQSPRTEHLSTSKRNHMKKPKTVLQLFADWLEADREATYLVTQTDKTFVIQKKK